MKTNVVSQALGSAYVELGATKVLASVFGPRNDTRRNAAFSEIGQIRCDVKYSSLSFRNGRRERTQLPEEIELSSMVEQAVSPAVILDKFPKCVLWIVLEIIDGSGSEAAAAIQCAGLALIDAAVEMYDIVTASSVSIRSGQFLVDPTHEEAQQADAEMTLAFMPTLGQVIHLWQTGQVEYRVAQEGMDLCRKACVKNQELVKTCLIP